MDKEVDWGTPGKRAHRQSIGAAVMDGKLHLKVRQRKERMERIKAFLVFPMAALHFAIMPGCVRANELMADSQVGSGFLKKGGDVSIAVGKTVSKFKRVVSLDTSIWIPLRAYHFTSRFRKSAEE